MTKKSNVEKDVIPPMRKNVSQAPHVVILGAGASLAAFPKGDKSGNKLPLMNSLAKAINLQEIIPEQYFPLLNNFENLYSAIAKDPTETEVKAIIENKVYQYFYELELPDTPTLYDYLILSLREKDIIATFNWDPLLLKCLRRHENVKRLPKVVFLHGNVAVGLCMNCKIIGYSYNRICHRCYKPFEPMKLLYPIDKKDYSTDISINGEWEELKWYLQHALYTTIFGYSAPASDVEAKELMLKAAASNKSKVFSEIEIIDIKPEDEVEENWDPFFYKNHYSIVDKFQQSYLWYHPRRSCDAFFSAYLMNTPWSDNPFPKFKSISEMHNWLKPLLDDEEKVSDGNAGFTYKAK
ncbi:MAG: hypothetical protein SGI96_21755 [Bacteroidota bacterium]|nr:hypothetical protein [Bacteroidota bacterium]